MIRTTMVAVLVSLACVPVAHAYGPPSGPYGMPVALVQAHAQASGLALLKPGARHTFATPCRAWKGAPALGYGFTETSAYTDTAGPLGGQHRHGARIAWHGVRGAVTYDTRTGTFRNGTARRVLVAGWCS